MSDDRTAASLHPAGRHPRRGHRDRWAAAAGLLGPFAATLALAPVRGVLPNTDAALLLVAVIVAVAANGSRAAGLLASASAAASFDFFLAAPFERLTISHGVDVVTTGLVLAVGAAVTEIAARARRHHLMAATEAAYLDGIARCVDLLARGAGTVEVVARVNRLLVPLLGVRSCRFASGRRPAPPAPEIGVDGLVRWGETVWDVERHGLPNEELEVIARRGNRVYGRFVLQPVVGAAPTRDARRAAAVPGQIAAAALAAGVPPIMPEAARTGVVPAVAGRAGQRPGLRMATPRHP
jgi:hypothetical protein